MRARTWKCLLFLIALSSSAVAYAKGARNCPLPPEGEHFYSLANLPDAIRLDFIAHIHGEIAAPEEAFNETDVVDEALPMRRLAEVRHRQSRWLIIYEVGGLAPHLHLVAYALSPGKRLELIANIAGVGSRPCADIDRWLVSPDGIKPEIESHW